MINQKIKSLIKRVVVPIHFKFRQVVGGDRMQPSFIIVGAQKAGTTSLYNYLIQHPKIKSTLLKEVHYFDLNYHKPISWYETFFPLKKNDDSITGEASPYYMFHPLALQRIAKHNPDVKIILLLRDPVKRAISHYYHEVRLGREKLGIKEAFDAEESRLAGVFENFKNTPNYNSNNHQRFSYKSRGIYINQINEIKKYFKSENIKIIDSKYFFNQTQDVVKEVLNFLNVDASLKIETNKKFNAWKRVKDPNETLVFNELKSYYKLPNEQLFQELGKPFDWE